MEGGIAGLLQSFFDSIQGVVGQLPVIGTALSDVMGQIFAAILGVLGNLPF